MREKSVSFRYFNKVCLAAFFSLCLCVFLMIGVVHSTVYAEGIEPETPIRASFSIPAFSDTSYNKFTVINNIYYAEDRDGPAPGKHSAGDKIPMYQVTFADGSSHTAYCIEPGEDVSGDWIYGAVDESITADLHWLYLQENYPRIAENIQITVGCASKYSYDKEARAAAQIIIWELVSGMRDKDSGEVINKYLRDCMDGAGGFDEYYNLFDRYISEYRKVPGCLMPQNNSEHTLVFSQEEQAFFLTLEEPDSPYFKSVDWELLTGLEVCELSDTKVVLKSTEYSSIVRACSGFKNTGDFYTDDGVFYIINSTSGGYRGQTLVSGIHEVTVPVGFKYKYEDVGILKILKTSEDGNVSGICFEVSDTANDTVICAETDSAGFAELYLADGTYEVREIVPEGYNDVPVQTVEIAAGETENVIFYNSLIKFYNLEVNYFERATGTRLENTVSAVLIEGSSYNLYDEVMLPIDGYIWDGYEGDEYEGENLSSDKVIDVYYVTVPVIEPEVSEEVIPDTDDRAMDILFPFVSAVVIVLPNFIYRKRFYAQ